MRRLFPISSRRTGAFAVSLLIATQRLLASSTVRRRLLIRMGTSLLLVAVVMAFLAGVATNHLLPFTNGGATTAAPKRGGSIVDGIQSEPDSLLPLRTGINFGPLADQAIWAPLWYGDPQGAFHAGLAMEVPSASNGDVSPDLRTWTIHLRSGLKWSDGTPLTAADCAYSFNLYADPAYGATFPTTDPNDPIGFQRATALDATTVVLTFKHHFVAMTAVLADGAGTCLPKEVFAGMTAEDISQSSQNNWPTIVSGPFKVKERVGDDHLTAVRNPFYYQGPDKPYLDQITFKDYNAADALAALRTRTVDTTWNLIDYASLASLHAIAGYTIYLDHNPAAYELLVFNLTDPLMSDHAIRQAFTMGFDTHTLLPFVPGAAHLTCDDATGTFAHEASLAPCYQYNPAAASRLLDADGWVMGADGVRHKNGQPLDLRLATTSRPVRQQIANLIQHELATIGITLEVQTVDPADMFGSGSGQVLAGGHFQIAEFANNNSLYDPDDRSFFASDQTPEQGGSNYMHYANPEVDAQERVQEATADISARKAAFHIIHEDVLKDVPVMYLYSPQNIACARSDLHNYDPSAEGATETWNIWDWWLGTTTS